MFLQDTKSIDDFPLMNFYLRYKRIVENMCRIKEIHYLNYPYQDEQIHEHYPYISRSYKINRNKNNRLEYILYFSVSM